MAVLLVASGRGSWRGRPAAPTAHRAGVRRQRLGGCVTGIGRANEAAHAHGSTTDGRVAVAAVGAPGGRARTSAQ
jgi:hypothetical protein